MIDLCERCGELRGFELKSGMEKENGDIDYIFKCESCLTYQKYEWNKSDDGSIGFIKKIKCLKK